MRFSDYSSFENCLGKSFSITSSSSGFWKVADFPLNKNCFLHWHTGSHSTFTEVFLDGDCEVTLFWNMTACSLVDVYRDFQNTLLRILGRKTVGTLLP